MIKKLIHSIVITMAWFAFSTSVSAESSKDVGNYVVHFNALSTEFLPPNVAQSYQIKRSKNRGFLNVSVLKKGEGFEGVEAKVSVYVVNLVGQLRTLDIREIKEQNAVYYISDFSVSHLEIINFKIKVITADNKTSEIAFKHQFYTQ